MFRWRSAGVVGVVVLGLAVAGCGTNSDASGGGSKVELALVAYSTPQAAYEALIKAFQKTPEGKNVSFTKSFGGSGDQSRAVEAGLKADIVAFSLEPDMTRLVKKGLVADDWKSQGDKGNVSYSVVALATRKGNPKGIKDWDDLTKPGVEVITPNPFTSGGARWNVLAGYGAKSNKGADKQAGVAYLDALFKNVPVQDDSARKALQTFVGGKGDVMIAYENEAIYAQQQKQPIDYVIPDSTILIQNPVAVTKNSAHPTEAAAFLKYLFSKEGQQIFANNGYRPISKETTANFPTPAKLFTIEDLGGWSKVNTDFFDPQNGIMAGIEKKLGVSTSK
jgi:sulfate transport system substrate-binding protein